MKELYILDELLLYFKQRKNGELNILSLFS